MPETLAQLATQAAGRGYRWAELGKVRSEALRQFPEQAGAWFGMNRVHHQAMKLIRLVGLAFLLAGCASLLLTPEQKQAALDAQQFADRIADAYNVPKVRVVMGSSSAGVVAWPTAASMRSDGVLFVEPNTPAWLQDVMIAHEMAHWINRDLEQVEQIRREVGSNQNALFERIWALELEADATAVEILQRVNGLSERAAFTLVHRSLERALRIQRAQTQHRMVGPSGHLLACETNAYLLKRFPAQAEWAKLCYY